MIEVLEIPVLTVQKQQKEILLDNLNFNVLPGQKTISYAEYTLSAKKRIFFYLLDNFLDCLDFSIYDRLIPKACFSWLIFERRNALFDTIQKQYNIRYSTPLLLITPKPIDESLKLIKEPEQKISMLYYDSQAANPLPEILKSSFAKYLEMNSDRNKTAIPE